MQGVERSSIIALLPARILVGSSRRWKNCLPDQAEGLRDAATVTRLIKSSYADVMTATSGCTLP
jgi:hypothetical protein